MRQAAASPLAPGDRYPHPHRQQVQQVPERSTSRPPLLDQDHNGVYRINPRVEEDNQETRTTNSPKTTVIMTGNGFFVASSGGLAKTKSGTLPPGNDHYYSSPPARGFRDTFVSSMNPNAPPSHSSATSSPHHHNHPTTTIMGNRNERNSSPVKDTSSSANNTNANSGSKRWTFGGLFKRKVKAPSASGNINSQAQSPILRTSSPMTQRAGSMSQSSPSPAPQNSGSSAVSISTKPYPTAQFHHLAPNAQYSPNSMLIRSGGGSGVANGNKYVSTPTQTRHKGKLSESDITSEDSELDGETDPKSQSQPHNQSQTQQPAPFKQNFLTRRLSRRKEKAAAKKKAADENGLLKVPKLNNGKRVGSSPDSLNNGNTNIFGFGSNGPWPSWEITKKVPQLQAVNNYSSSGSLSLSQEGSTKGSRVAAKEAVKARAVARRESFIQDSSSDEEDRSRSSIQGSHSSLSVRNGRRPLNGISNVNNNYQPHQHQAPLPPPSKGQTFRPVVDYVRNSPSSPAKFDRHNNNSASPKLQKKVGAAPGSPRWEARVIYTQENHENETPFVVKLPSNRLRPPPASQHQLQQSSSPAPEEHHVITAGLRVPISGGERGNGNQITEEVHYANLPSASHNPRFRSATPLNYHNVNATHQPSPPPPPPRREFNRLLPANNQNFYRPVSCSYLDSYQGYYNHNLQQAPPVVLRNASPNPNINRVNNTTSFITPGYYEGQHEPPKHQFQPQQNGNYYLEDQVDNARHNNNHFLLPNNALYHHQQQQYNKHLHPALMRSPSEPPEIKVQYARRESPVRRNASTPTPAPTSYYYNNNQDPNETRQVITSKMGYPVRKLQDAGKIPLAQSPVHMRASEFWRKKEAEVTGNAMQPNPNHQRYMTRIRSADSSPLPVHRMLRNSPAIQNSNESISSLSSFSAEAASPHSHMFGTPSRQQRMARKIQNSGGDSTTHGNNPNANNANNSRGTVVAKTSENFGNMRNPRQESGLSKSDNKEKTQNPNLQSAGERLSKMRIPSAPETKVEYNKMRSLVDLNNGKSPGRNLEDALNELEDMYKSLRLSDEDLLDRAERRDLPTPHQELRNAPLIPLPQSFRYEGARGSVESLATGSSSTGSGTNYSNSSRSDNPNRVRAPPLRRSSRPDTVQDDMARRRFDHQQDTKPLDPRNVVAQTGSYMVLSPAFSPPVSPCPPDTLPFSLLLNQDEPDLTYDDVSFRTYKQANSIKIIDPQPLFGIPLGPITAAPGTDYLHSKRSDRLRPLFKAVKNPDLVNDDIAFRNLRKDLNSDNNLSKDWTPRLFSPTRDNTFNYNVNMSNQDNKKLRAIRSLSANITNYVPFSEFEMGKWNSFTDLHQHESRGSPRQTQRGSTYWRRPSWVEQVEKVQSSNNKFPPEPEEHWERKLPSKTVQLTPDLYDPTKSRRPWTDIILESFEKERQQELERIAAEEAAANAANVNSNGNLEVTEEDDDVFLDARDKSKSTSPEERLKNFQASLQHNQQHLLLQGQNTRRGSWVEPRTSSTYLSASDYGDDQDRRRKSWSDVPKDHDQLFNPLPPPKKIKQINLDKFNASRQERVNYGKEKSSQQQDIPKGEAELNALMDMLIREADTCDTTTTTTAAVPSANSDTKTTHVNVSLSLRRREEKEEAKRESELNQDQRPNTKKDEMMSVPKIPQKESQIDEPTKRSEREQVFLASTTPDSPPEIVAVSRKTTTTRNDNRNTSKVGDSNLPLNYSTSSTIITTTFPENDPFSSSSRKSCSIDDLIDSINESLPELEAGCTSSSTKSTGGSSLSSVGSGSRSPPSIPSPRPGSPTTIIQLDLVKDTEKLEEDNTGTIQIQSTSVTSTSTSIPEEVEKSDVPPMSRRSSTNSSTSSGSGESQKAGPSSQMKKEEPARDKNERNVGKEKNSGCQANFPFLRNSSSSRSRSRSHSLSVGESVSSSPTNTSEFGEGRKEKDKSHKRKSHLNRAFTSEPVPAVHSFSFHPPPQPMISTCAQEGGKKSSSICKVPPIPSILTTNNHSNSTTTKTADNSISTRQLPPSPSLKQKSYKSNILHKVQTFESRSAPVVKQDSFLDAEGVSFIKKLLHKESMAEKEATQVKQNKHQQQQQHQSFVLKKSPSTGSTSSKHWSNFENSQPVFLKKFFEKSNSSNNCADVNAQDEKNGGGDDQVVEKEKSVGVDDAKEGAEVEPVISYSVAQKASFFMKLEHEQRFSKWRKNSLDGDSPLPTAFAKTTTNLIEPVVAQAQAPQPPPQGSQCLVGRSRSRQLTQPITTTEVQLASLNTTVPTTPRDQTVSVDMHNNNIASSGRKAENSHEPSQRSLKDRVHMFDKLIAVGAKAPSSASVVGSAAEPKTAFPMKHSSSAVMPSSIPISQRISAMPMNFQVNKHATSHGNIPQQSERHVSAFSHRRGSTSDLELPGVIAMGGALHPHPKPFQIVSNRDRSAKTRSLFVNNDESEDGEVSSGGQEVADIISRSYENTPIARKKSLKNQNQSQATFTKEIWRRCKVNENNFSAKDCPQTYKVTTNVTHLTNDQVCETSSNSNISNAIPNTNSSPQTSNLLQILTVLTGSTDELDKNKGNSNGKRSLGNSGGSSASDNHSRIPVVDKSNLNSSRVPVPVPALVPTPTQVHVFHPDDESFQLFFGKSVASTMLPNDCVGSSGGSGINLSSPQSGETQLQQMDVEMNVIQRESDLLVMKKNVPLLRRKSSGKSRNPLKTLAARMDFRNQWYTDETP